jgi:hypothetical protein
VYTIHLSAVRTTPVIRLIGVDDIPRIQTVRCV